MILSAVTSLEKGYLICTRGSIFSVFETLGKIELQKGQSWYRILAVCGLREKVLPVDLKRGKPCFNANLYKLELVYRCRDRGPIVANVHLAAPDSNRDRLLGQLRHSFGRASALRIFSKFDEDGRHVVGATDSIGLVMDVLGDYVIKKPLDQRMCQGFRLRSPLFCHFPYVRSTFLAVQYIKNPVAGQKNEAVVWVALPSSDARYARNGLLLDREALVLLVG